MRFDTAVLHYSASGDVPAATIDAWHGARGFTPRGTNPLRHIGYHYVVRRSGVVELGRSLDAQPTHCPGYNRRGVLAICFCGNTRDKTPWFPTEEQYHSGREILVRHGLPPSRIFGHGQLVPTHCPGPLDVQRLRAMVAEAVPREEEGEEMIRTSDRVAATHHFLDMWSSRYDLQWLHVQLQDKKKARVEIYATRDLLAKPFKSGQHYQLLHTVELEPREGNPNPYVKIPIGAVARAADAVDCAISVHATRDVACALREDRE